MLLIRSALRSHRAYVNHLLETHEMLADVLLDVHNLHHNLRFFAALRDAIAAGGFADFADFHAARAHAARVAAAEAALSS